jgi:hypothetical protein
MFAREVKGTAGKEAFSFISGGFAAKYKKLVMNQSARQLLIKRK